MKDRDKSKEVLAREVAELRQEVNELRLTEQRLRIADKALHYRILFEDLIMRISTEFISLPTDKISSGIARALKAIGGFCGVDRSYLLQLTEDTESLVLSEEWHTDGFDSPDRPFGTQPLDSYGWIAQALQKGKTIHISRLQELPAEAEAERLDLERNGVKSLLLAPIFYAGRMIGVAGFDALRTERVWPEDIIALLRIIGEVFANALMRIRSLEAMEEKDSSLDQTQKALRFMQFAVDHAADSIYWIGEDARLIYANEAASSSLGYSPKEMMKLRVWDFDKDFTRDRWLASWKHLKKEGSTTVESTHIRKDGSTIPVEISANFVKMEGESFCCALARDIADRKESDEVQRRLNVLLDSIIENIPAMITLKETENLRYIRSNRAGEELLGLSREDLIGRTDHDLYPPDRARFLTDRDKQVLEEGSLVDIESDILETEQLGRIILHTKKIPILGEDGSIKYLLGISEDVTKSRQVKEELRQYQNHLEDLVKARTASVQKANEDLQKEIAERREAQAEIRELNEGLEKHVRERTSELEKALEDLKRLDEMKDAFVSSVSHELRTPLTSIRSYSEVLLQYEDESPETRREFLGIIKLESERLSRLIEDVLDISRIQSQGMIWNDEEVCLNEVIDHVANVLRNQAELKKLEILVDATPDLPHIIADRDRIEQVFQNLISNAIKFSRKGGTIEIHARAHQGRRGGEEFHWVRMSVSDEGSGIDEKDFEIIFDRFQQANQNTLVDKPKGTGLGLPICKDIVTHYEGSIWVESKMDSGSTFYFTLPAVSPATAGSPRRPGSPPAPAGRSDSKIQL